MNKKSSGKRAEVAAYTSGPGAPGRAPDDQQREWICEGILEH